MPNQNNGVLHGKPAFGTFFRRAYCLLLLVLICPLHFAFAQQHPQALPGPSGPSIKILGPSRAVESAQHQWVSVLAERPIKDSGPGYEPPVPNSETDSTPLRAKYELPIEFVWNFGDGTGPISTGERPSITHNYPDNGDFTMRVEAISEGQVFAAGEKLVKVRNRRPRFALLAAALIDPSTNTFELTAQATDVYADPLTYDWDFGDGQTLVSDQWRMEHRYQPGSYTVKVNIKDDEGESREATQVLAVSAAGAPSDTISPLEQAPDGAAQTSINLSVNGAIDFQFTGEIRPTVGIYLTSRKPESGCRFLFTAWDNANLAHLGVIFDLKRVDPEGAVYTFDKPRVWLNLESNPQAYEQQKRLMSEGNVMGGISGQLLAIPGVAELNEEQLRGLGNQVGIQPGVVEPSQPIPVASSSPFGIEDHEGFQTESGTAGLMFIPRDRAAGRFAVQLRNSDRRSLYQSMALEGEFV
ncbi:MAG: PKD repeat protein, partial [Myxococcota bacterium]